MTWPSNMKMLPWNRGFFGKHTGIVQEITSGKIVRAVHNNIIISDKFLHVVRFQSHIIGHHSNIRVQAFHIFLCRLDLRPTKITCMDHLALQVAHLHHIIIDNAKLANSCSSKILYHRRAKTTPEPTQRTRDSSNSFCPSSHHGIHNNMLCISFLLIRS